MKIFYVLLIIAFVFSLIYVFNVVLIRSYFIKKIAKRFGLSYKKGNSYYWGDFLGEEENGRVRTKKRNIIEGTINGRKIEIFDKIEYRIQRVWWKHFADMESEDIRLVLVVNIDGLVKEYRNADADITNLKKILTSL